MAYEGPERRQYHEIPDEMLDHIAERAAEKVLNKVYQGVGRSVVRKASWVVGVFVIFIAIWLGGKGYLR